MSKRCAHNLAQGFFRIQCARTAESNSNFCVNHGGVPDQDFDTLAKARREVFAKLDDGTQCPCCDKYAKRYRRKVNCEMAMFLIGLVRLRRLQGDVWWSYRAALAQAGWGGARAGDYAYLQHWGLVLREKFDDGVKWRVVDKGWDFVLGRVEVPKYVWLYNDRPEAFSSETTTIKEALSSRFDYEELMRSYPCPTT